MDNKLKTPTSLLEQVLRNHLATAERALNEHASERDYHQVLADTNAKKVKDREDDIRDFTRALKKLGFDK